MTTIAPSLLACDFLNIESELRAFDGVKDLWFHLDIMDGHFVPNLTFGHPIVEKIAQKSTQLLDAHFMVTNPEFYIDTFKNLHIHNFTFHLEACRDSSHALELVKKAKTIYPSVGLSIKPGTPAHALTPQLLQAVDLVLVMSVEPGFGGQGFIDGTWSKLQELAPLKNQFNFQIQVDGGVGDSNAKKLVEAGVDNLVAGSYVFKPGASQYLNQINKLRHF